TYLLGRRSLGDRAALAGALLLTLAPGNASMARLLILDGLLTLFVCLAIFSAFEAVRGPVFQRRWWLVAAFACGLGVLTKGPVAVLLLLPPLWLYRVLAQRNGTEAVPYPSRTDWLLFATIVLATALPWYVALSCRLPGFVSYFFWEHNLRRF